MKTWNRIWTLGLDRPRLALSAVALLVVGALLLVVFGPLEVSTSRRGLVSLHSPYQARLFRYYEAFGRSELAVLVVTGDSVRARQAFVDHFEAELGKLPEFQGRVLGKVTLDDVAETLFAWQPELLEQLASFGSPKADSEAADAWVAWSRAAERRLTDQLGDAEADAGTGAKPGDATADERRLSRVADMVAGFRRAIETDGRLAVGQLGLGNTPSRLDADGYVTAGDSAHLVLIFPALQSDEGRELQPLVARIRGARDRALGYPDTRGVHADLTGAPALAVDELASLNASNRSTSLLSAGGLLLFLVWAFRSFRHAFITIVPLLAGIVITLGFVELVYDGLNLVTSAFMSVLMGLGIDFGIHLLHRYQEERETALAVHPALRAALVSTGPAIMIGAVTTMIGFLTTALTEFAAFRALGIITAVGLFINLACAFLLVPWLVAKLAAKHEGPMRELPGMAPLARWVGRGARWVLVGTALVTLLAMGSLLSGLPKFNGRYFDFLPEKTESYRALEIIRRGGTPPAEAHFVVGSFERARQLTQQLRARPEVSVVQSASDLLPPETPERIRRLRQAVTASAGKDPVLPQVSAKQASARLEAFSDLQDAFDELAHALRQANRNGEPASRVARELGALVRWLKAQPDLGTSALNRMARSLSGALSQATRAARKIAARGHFAPEDLPPVFKARFVSKDGKRLAVHTYPAGDVWESAFSDRFAASLRALDPEVAGVALNVVPHQRYITDAFQRAAVYSLIIVSLLVWLTFRRFKETLLSLLPVTLGCLWMLGLMRPLGIDFTPANMVVLPLIFGIGVDSAVHIVLRAGQTEGTANLTSLLQGTGAAVTLAALTAIIGFGALMVAEYRAMQSLGILLSLGAGLCLFASMVVLPALLVLLGRAR